MSALLLMLIAYLCGVVSGIGAFVWWMLHHGEDRIQMDRWMTYRDGGGHLPYTDWLDTAEGREGGERG